MNEKATTTETTKQANPKYPAIVCDQCRVGIHNDDWTHLDNQDQESADESMTRIASMLELYGWLTEVGPADQPGYFDCDICWEIQCGGGHRFEGDKDPSR